MVEIIDNRLAEDHWFVYNTLSLISPYLETPDLLRCSLVCKLWHTILQDPIFWKTVIFTNCTINCDKLSQILREQKTVYLKSYNCQFFQLGKGQSQNQNLKTLENNECLTELSEIFLNETQNLYNSYKISIMDFLRELRLYCPSKIRINIGFFFSDLRNLKVLYLLSFENLTFDENFNEIKNNKLEILALGNVFYMPQEKMNFILQASPNLEKLRLETCINWNSVEFLKTIGQMKNMTCLELLNFRILEDFHIGFNFCQNIKELTVMPGCDTVHMTGFNTRIILALRNLRKLKKFTLGFSEQYLAEMQELTGQLNVISIFSKRIEQGNGRPAIYSDCLRLPLDKAEVLLSKILEDAHVKIVKNLDCLEGIFINNHPVSAKKCVRRSLTMEFMRRMRQGQ